MTQQEYPEPPWLFVDFRANPREQSEHCHIFQLRAVRGIVPEGKPKGSGRNGAKLRGVVVDSSSRRLERY